MRLGDGHLGGYHTILLLCLFENDQNKFFKIALDDMSKRLDILENQSVS